MNARENILKAIHFERPDYIPMTFKINDACWNAYPKDALLDLMADHPLLFPDFQRSQYAHPPAFSNVARKDSPYCDDFGCLWKTSTDGITGVVTEHPLADWDSFSQYQMPDPEKCVGIGSIDWQQEKQRIENRKSQHLFTKAGLRHGHTFLQLCDLRGYENLMFDMADEESRLFPLISQIENFNLSIIRKYLAIGVDLIAYPEDLGMQYGPMLSPEYFRQYILPSYRRLMEPAREKGVPIHMHSDGDIRLLADDLLSLDISVLNLQDLVNGLDWIKENLFGRVCIELDIDRQNITAQGTPAQIQELIQKEVQLLGSRQGGLMMIYGLYPGVPLENVRALMDAMEKFSILND